MNTSVKNILLRAALVLVAAMLTTSTHARGLSKRKAEAQAKLLIAEWREQTRQRTADPAYVCPAQLTVSIPR